MGFHWIRRLLMLVSLSSYYNSILVYFFPWLPVSLDSKSPIKFFKITIHILPFPFLQPPPLSWPSLPCTWTSTAISKLILPPSSCPLFASNFLTLKLFLPFSACLQGKIHIAILVWRKTFTFEPPKYFPVESCLHICFNARAFVHALEFPFPPPLLPSRLC